jgi:hypothetical protein
VLAREPHRLHHIRRATAPDDKIWTLVDGRIPYGSGLFIFGIAGERDLAADSRTKSVKTLGVNNSRSTI